ncbi:hypothetical protein [Methylocystis heyeri]|uniref:Uncharacterized protein n=1 Tax=Methylocystis heyeri TaxID=391905 RepID=A0A6B8KFR4_9HYPH|nr:hypothetical protein [Methylocystis heyeri]QGM45378.1 hypothetical protein H2LOC_006515 [Methylocystis heyeri]
MPQQFVTEFQELSPESPEHDLMARLYREIGLSAVAAALGILNSPQDEDRERAREFQTPAFLTEESLAA